MALFGFGRQKCSGFVTLLDALPTAALLVSGKDLRIIGFNKRAAVLLGLVNLKAVEESKSYLSRIFKGHILSQIEDAILKCKKTEKNVSFEASINIPFEANLIQVSITVGYLKKKECVLLTLYDSDYQNDRNRAYMYYFYSVFKSIYSLPYKLSSLNDILIEVANTMSDTGLFTYIEVLRNRKCVYKVGNFKDRGDYTNLQISPYYSLLIYKNKGQEFTSIEVEFLSDIAKYIAGIPKASVRDTNSGLTDKLTGLPSREVFFQYLNAVIQQSSLTKTHFGLMVLDIDKFGEINQTFGNRVGDRVLLEIVARLKKVIRSTDFLARTGSDEFSIIFLTKEIVNNPLRFIKRIKNIVEKPILIDHQYIYITFSIGIALYPMDADAGDALYSAAYMAAKQAKKFGGNAVELFSSKIAEASRSNINLVSEIRKGFEKGEFTIFFQPKVDISTEKIVGAEALIRWVRNGNITPPAKFLPVIEEGELIHEVGEFVIKEVCRTLQNLEEEKLKLPIAINISPYQLRYDLFLRVSQLIKSICKGSIGYLEIEITESAIMEDLARSIAFIEDLSRHNIKTYIDDFGTGYSSLAYLKKLPVHAIKIDREFIKDFPADKGSFEIIRMIVNLAKGLGLKVVAEGVENIEQIKVLKELGCNFAQGFYFSKPMPFMEFKELLSRGRF